MKSSIKKPNFKVKHPYGYLIKSMLVGFILVFSTILSFGTGLIDLKPKSNASAAEPVLTDAFSTANSASGSFSGGTGTATNPYLISDVDDWVHFYWHVANRNGGYGYYYQLTNDIDFSGYWYDTHIGAEILTAPTSSKAVTTTVTGKSFAGVFWGEGHRLKNITVGNEDVSWEGVWLGGVFNTICGYYAPTTTINATGTRTPVGVYDLIVVDFDGEGLGYDDIGSGILADQIRYARIANVYCYTTKGLTMGVSAGMRFGGVIGTMAGSQLWACQSEGYTIYSHNIVGGIVAETQTGYGNNYISNCRNMSKIVAGTGDGSIVTEGWSAGGILGGGTFASGAETVIQNSVNLGEVTTTIYGTPSTGGTAYYSNTLLSIHGIAGGANSTSICGATVQNSYLDIFRCYNDAPVRVRTSSTATINATYGIAHTFYGNSGHLNFYNSTYNNAGAYPSTSYVSALTSFVNNSTLDTATYAYQTAHTMVHSGNMFSMKGGYPSTSYSTSYSSSLNRYADSTSPYYTNFTTTGKIVEVLNFDGDSGVTHNIQPYSPRYTVAASSSSRYLFDQYGDADPILNGYPVAVTFPAGYSLDLRINKYTVKGIAYEYPEYEGSLDRSTTIIYTIPADNILDYSITLIAKRILKGAGTIDNPYQIASLEDARTIGSYDGEGVYFALTDDFTIDEKWENNYSLFHASATLNGILLGRGHTITFDFGNDYSQLRLFEMVEGAIYDLNIYIKNPINTYDDQYQNACCYPGAGGFICEENYGVIDSVRIFMDDATFYLDKFAGNDEILVSMIAIWNNSSGIISNCLVTGIGNTAPTISLALDDYEVGYLGIYYGAMAAINAGTVIGCVANTDIYIDQALDENLNSGIGTSIYAGGIVGYDSRVDNYTTTEVSNNYFQGIFTSGGNYNNSSMRTAGIVGGTPNAPGQNYANTVHHNIARATGPTTWQNQIICDDYVYTWPENYYIGESAPGMAFSPYVATVITEGDSFEDTFGDEVWDSRYWMPSRDSGLGNFVPGYNMYAPRNFKKLAGDIDGEIATNWVNSAYLFVADDTYGDQFTISGNTATINSAGGLAELAGMIIKGNANDVTKIVLNADIDLSDLYWSSIPASSRVNEFDGQGHTIYGLDSMGDANKFDSKNRIGGLFHVIGNVHDVVFENCILHDAIGVGYAGFVANYGTGEFKNITFKNCVIYNDLFDNHSKEETYGTFGFVSAHIEGGLDLSHITITGSDIVTMPSTIKMVARRASSEGARDLSIGGLVGDAIDSILTINDSVINGLELCLDNDGFRVYVSYFPGAKFGAVVGGVNASRVTLNRVDVLQYTLRQLADMDGAEYSAGLIGEIYEANVSINDSIINTEIYSDISGSECYMNVGGIVGYSDGMLDIYGCDINVVITQTASSLNSQFEYLHGLVGYNEGEIQLEDSIYRFDGSTFNTGIVTYNDGGEIYIERNIIALRRDGSTTPSHYNCGYGAPTYDNVVYGYGNTTTSDLFDGTAKKMFTDDDMYSLLKPFNDMGIGNSFYANKYIAYGSTYLGEDLAYRGAELYGSGDNLTPLSTADGSAYFHVYNTISPGYAAKLVYYNTAGASDSTVTIHRGGYNISSMSASGQYGQTPNIWYTEGDPFEFYLNDSSYIFSAELQELNEIDDAVERVTIIAPDGSSFGTQYEMTSTDVDYASSYTPVLLVKPALGARYFAIHKDMTISSGTATQVATRGNYKIYSATPNSSISVRISGNTLGYSASATSYYTGLKKGTINTSGTYTNSSNLTASSSSASASGHYTYTFTVNSTYSSASSTGSVITYDYISATLYRQQITYSADTDGAGNSMTTPGSTNLYFTTSLTGSTKYTSLYVKSGTTITATYPSTSGEWTRTSTALNSGSLTTNTNTSASYSSTTAARTLTVTYACNTYEVEVWIYQEAAQSTWRGGDYLLEDYNPTYLGHIAELDMMNEGSLWIWGGYPKDLPVTTGGTTQTAYNALYSNDVGFSILNNVYRSAYITYNSKNYIGSITASSLIDEEWNVYPLNYRSYITAVKYNTSMTVTAVSPSMYKLSGATYTYSNKSTTSGSGTATISGNNITFSVLGSTTLKVDFKQDKWDSNENYAAASLSSGSYVIDTAAKFGWMVAKINESATYAGYSYSISADIDLAGKYISPITRVFTGTINGNQYTIENLNSWQYSIEGFISTNSGTIQNVYFKDPVFNCSWESFIGFVASNSATGIIKNIGMFTEDATRASLYRCPAAGDVAFVRDNYGIIDSCFDASSYYIIDGNYRGLALSNDGTLSNSYTNVSYETPSTLHNCSNPNSGSLIASINTNTGYIYNCYARVITPHDIAGAIYTNDGTVTNVFIDREIDDMNGAVYKTPAEMATASTFSGWQDFAQKWVMKTGYGTYKNQAITGYPLLNMGDTSDLVEVHFRATIRQDGGTTENVEISSAYGWQMSTDVVYAANGVPFTFTLSAANILSVSPYFEKAVTSEGFATAITGNATNRYGDNTFTWTPAFTSGVTEAYITLHFYYPTITMTGDYALSTGTLSARASGAFTAANADNTVGYSWNYGLDTAKKAIRIQTIKVCGVDVLTSGSTTAITRYIYKNGSTYTANTSDSGTGSKVCKVIITPSSATGGKIEISHQKEDVTITTVTYINISVSFSGLASGTTNTITTYQKLGSSGSASAIKTVRASGATTASGTVSVGWYPIISGSTYYYYGNILGGNTTGYTYYQAGYNGSTSVVNANYASTDNYTHYVSANDLAGASSSPATFNYTYGPGKFTYTISLYSVSYLTTKPTTITITPSGTGVSDAAKSFSSVAANQTVTFDVLSGNTPKFTASYTAGSGKVYRFIWGSTLSSGTANAQLTASSATQARTYYVSPIERYNFTATASLSMTNGGRTYATTHAGKYPQVSITYAKNSSLAGSTGTTVNNSTTSASISTGQVVDHGSAVSFAQSLNRTVDSTNGVTLAHVYTFGSWTNGSAISSATANVSATANYSVIVRTITTRITNKDLTIHPDAYIGIASNAGDYTFNSSTLHTTNASGHYYIYYNGLTTSTGSGDNVTRGYRTFYVTGGEYIIAERWDKLASNYVNLIASITHTSSSNTAAEVYSSSASGVLIGLATYVKANDDFRFTYFPLVEVNLARDATTTSVYATNNKDTLLPITSTRSDSANIKVKGTKTSGTNPPYAYSTIDDTDNLFEPIVYMQLSYTVPTANLTGWNFNGWYISSTAIGTSGSKTVNSVAYTMASTTSGTNTIYTLTFTIPAQSTEEGNSINTFQYYIKFTEKTYTFTTYTNLTSGGSTAANNAAASRSLFEYTSSSYTDSTKKTVTLTTSGTNHTATIAYYGYYLTQQDSTDTNNYAYASGITINNCTTTAVTVSGIDAAIKFTKPTANVSAYATYKKWHTISAPTITIDYYTSGYTDNQYNVTNSGYVYTFNARTSSSTANVAQIGTITLSGITDKNGTMKVLEGATLTISVTTNTNKFRITTTPSSKTITADSTVTAAYAENSLSVKFYKNTASTTQVGSTVTLGTLNAAYAIPATYQATAGTEYVFSHWTVSGSLTFASSTTLATSINKESVNGSNGGTINVYANWRRTYYMTWGTGTISTTHTTSGKTCAGGSVSITANGTAVSSKYSKASTATISNSVVTGHRFVSYSPSNATISGTTATRTYTSLTASSNQVTYSGTTLYVSGSYLYTNSAHTIMYSAYDYDISGTSVKIYDKAAATIGATFAELTYELTITQPTGGTITIDTSTSNGTTTNSSKPTAKVLGYFSNVVLKYTNTDPYYRFKGWNVDSTAFSNTIEPNDATVTLGPNVLKSSTVSVNEAVQRKITPDLWKLRYLTNNTATYPKETPTDIYLNGSTVVWKYTNAILYYSATNGAFTTTNWSYTCTANSSHTGSSLASRTTTCATCGSSARVTGVDMYVELAGNGLYLNSSTGKLYTDSGYKSELGVSYSVSGSTATIAGKTYPIVNNRVSYGGETVTIGMLFTSNSTYTVPESASAIFYKFTPAGSSTGAETVPFTNLYLGYNSTGSTTGNASITFLANGATLPNQSNTYSFGIRPYDDVVVDDDTSADNSHVYITSVNNPSIKVLEGANVTIIATDYNAATGDNKAYKFSHWTFTPADSGYSSNANWMEAEGLKYTKNPTFAVYASREGTYTAHYVYAYKMTTAQAYTTNGTSFTSATVATLTKTNPTYTDDTYAKGSTITLTPDFSKTNYTFYGWYLLSGTTYTAITSSTTGCSLNGSVLTITVGGATCDNATVTGGLDLSKYTIVLAGQEVLSYTFGSFSEVGPTATYTVTGAGIISATDGDGKDLAVSSNKVSASLAPGKVMTVKVKAGTSLTLSSTHTAGSYRATGMTFNDANIASTSVTLANNGLTGASRAALTTSASNDGNYRVVYTPVWTVAPTLAVSATHVTSGKTASFTGSSYITLSASGGYTYSGTTYYDDGTVLTLSKTLPTGYNFTSWSIAPAPTYSSGSATSESPKILLKAKLTTVTLNIKEKEYTVSANTINVTIPASSINNISDATTWTDTASSFGTITYTTNHTGGTGKVGYFGTISKITFTPYKYLYVNNSKLYYDANYSHPVYANLYKANSTTSFTYLGTTYTASSNKITLNSNLYTFTTFAKSGGGTLASATTSGSAAVNANFTENVTISASVNMYVYYNQSSYNLTTANSTVSGATTKSNTAVTLGSSVTLTAATISGYVFKGWKYSTYVNGVLTPYNSGEIVSTSTTYTFTSTEASNGVVYYAVYAPLYSITLDASTFNQGSITYQYKTPSAENYTTAVTITKTTTLTGIEYNTIFKLTATPSGQNRFNFWSTANSSVSTSTASYEYHLLATDTVTANFLTQYTITINHAVAAGGTYTVQEYNLGDNDTWTWEDCTGLVNVSGNKALTTADSGKDYRVVVSTKNNYRVAVSGTATATITGNNNYNNNSGKAVSTTATYTALNGAKTVTITHTPLTYVAVSTAPGGLGNTISISQSGSAILTSKSGTESIASTIFEGGKSMTITTTAVDGYGTPKFYNGSTLLAEGTSYTFTPATGTSYNISVKYTSTDITIDTVGYFWSFDYRSITNGTVGSYSYVRNDGTSSISLTSGATGIRFEYLFDSYYHTSVSLYAGETLVQTITSVNATIDYTLPVGSETPTLRFVFTNKTWLDSGYYTTPSGSGTPESPYIIDSAGDFAWISYESLVNNNNFSGKYFSLTADIDLSSRAWVPIQNFNGVIISTSLDNTINCDLIIAADSLQITGIGETSTSTYGGLVAESNGGVFRNITFEGMFAVISSNLEAYVTNAAVLCGIGTDMVVDNIHLNGIDQDFGDGMWDVGILISQLNGGKISNISYGDYMNTFENQLVHTTGYGNKSYAYLDPSIFAYEGVVIENIGITRPTKGSPTNDGNILEADNLLLLPAGGTINDFEWALSQLETNDNIDALYIAGTLDLGGQQLSRQYKLPAGKTVAGIDGIISNISAFVPFGTNGAIWTSIEGTLKNIIFQKIHVTAYTTTTMLSSEYSMGVLAGEVNGATIHNVGIVDYSLDIEASGTKIGTHINIGGIFGKVVNSNITYVSTTIQGNILMSNLLRVSHYNVPANNFNLTSDCNSINVGGFVGYYESTSAYQMKAISLVSFSISVKGDSTEKIGLMFGYANGYINNSYVLSLYGVYRSQSTGIGTFTAYGNLVADKLYAMYLLSEISDVLDSLNLPNLYSASNEGTYTNTHVHKSISSHASAKTFDQMMDTSTYVGWNFESNNQSGTVMWCPARPDDNIFNPYINMEVGFTTVDIEISGEAASEIEMSIYTPAVSQNVLTMQGAGTWSYDAGIGTILGLRSYFGGYLPEGVYLDTNESRVSYGIFNSIFMDDRSMNIIYGVPNFYGPSILTDFDLFSYIGNVSGYDYSFNFVFKYSAYTVSTSTNGHGTATGGGSYKYGETVTLTATPTANETYVGHRFIGWYKDGGASPVSTSQNYSFTMNESTAGKYEARFCDGNTRPCNYKATVSSTGATVSISPTDFVLQGTTMTITTTLGTGQEISKITRTSDSKDVYTKAGGAISGYTFTAPNKLSFAIDNTTKGAYTVTIGSTSHNITINVPNVGDGVTTGDGDAYSAHEAITMKSGSTTLGTIAADGVSGIATVVYNNTLTISFMSALRYKLGSIVTTQSGSTVTIAGTDSRITVTTSTVGGYTRYTYSYTTSAVTGDFTLNINMIKDRWVDFTSFSGTAFTAGHSAEFITANGGRVAYETGGSTTNYTFAIGSATTGIGTASNPFKIATAAQLARVAYLINTGARYYYSANGTSYAANYYYNAYYVITANIDLGNYFWTPINQNNATGASFSLGGDLNRTISNMNIRVDEEEYALESTGKRHIAFVVNCADVSLYNLTFDNANVVNNSIKDVYTSVVFSSGFNSSFAFITVQNSYLTTNHFGNLFGTGDYLVQYHDIRVAHSTIDTVNNSDTKQISGFVGDMHLSLANNVLLENITMKKNGSGYTYGAGFVVNMSSSTLRNIFVDVKSNNINNDYGLIGRYITRGNTYDNIWASTLSGYSNYYSNNGDSFVVNTLTSGSTLATYGLDSDEWYIDSTSKLPYPKMVGTGTNQITHFAEVVTGTISGSGTKSDPYLIDSAKTLRYITYLINSGNTTYNSNSVYYKLTADIDMSGGFSGVIGDERTQNSAFYGHIDGDFHTISNLYIFNKYGNSVGFIGCSVGATIKNLNFVNARIVNTKINGYAGGVTAYTTSGVLIDNVSFEGYILGHKMYTGGIAGTASTSSSKNVEISNVSFEGHIKGGPTYTAGILAFTSLNNNQKEIKISAASVSGSILSNNIAGGILGGIDTKSTYSDKVIIKDSFNNAKILNYYANGVGGIAGDVLNTTIENCYNNGTIVIKGQDAESNTSYYNSNSNWNNGTYSWANNLPLFVGEIVGRIYDGSVTYKTEIINTAFNQNKYIQTTLAGSNYLIPLGKSGLNGHTPNGYSVYSYTSSNVTYSNGIPEGEGQMYADNEMKTISPYTVWDFDTIWSDSSDYPVHRWNTQNRLYFEGEDLSIETDDNGVSIVRTVDGAYSFPTGVTPVTDTDGRIYVYVTPNTTLKVGLLPDENFSIASVESRAYYTSSYTNIMNGENIEYEFELGDYSDGTNFKVFKATFVNSKFTITVNTELVRGTGISVGTYETLHIVILNTTTNEAYTTSLDNGTYIFDDLKAGTYYIGVYTTMFFDVSDVGCTYDSSSVNFSEVDFYYSLVLSNSTSPNATIDITATKNVDAWIYSSIEIGA